MRSHLAPWSEIRRWFAVSAVITVVMLVGVTITAMIVPADPWEGQFSRLLGDDSHARPIPAGYEVMNIFLRNLLVLALHFFACLVGAIIGREHKPLPEKWKKYERFHSEMPKWVADASLAYAMTVTLASIALQTTGLGFVLADLSAYAQLAPWQLTLLVTPHAIPELIGIFLPLALFSIQARKHELRPLNDWAWQSFVIGLPLIFGAALIEVFVSPHLIEHFADPVQLDNPWRGWHWFGN